MLDREARRRGSDHDLVRRWRPGLPLLVAGGVSIVAGGLAAAVTGPTGWEHGSWVAAFLVLVAGVAQVGLAAGQAELAAAPAAGSTAAGRCAAWNAGCLLVIAGTLLSAPVAVAVGSVALLAVLAMSAVAVRAPARRPRLATAYRALLVGLGISVGIGVALAFAGS